MSLLEWVEPQVVEATEVETFPSNNQRAFAEIMSTHNLVEVVDNDKYGHVVIVTPRTASEQGMYEFAGGRGGTNTSGTSPDSVQMGELGSSSPSPFTSRLRQEYNRDLIGVRGLEMYDRMRKSDGTVRGTLRAVKTPVLSARWYMCPYTDGKTITVRDKNVADFIWNCLTEYMSIGFYQILTEMLLMCDFGYYMFEIVWEERVIDGKKRWIWSKLAPRHPMDVVPGGWHYDQNGGPLGVEMFSNTPNGTTTFISIDKLLVFTFDREAGNIEGISVLRSAYKHWYYKDQLYKIDAIQKERHGIGIPVITLPPGFSEGDKNLADEMGRNLRTNERAHIVLPPNWVLEFAELNGQLVDAMKSIEHHNAAIRENILATFLGNDKSTKEDDQTMFMKATRFIAAIIYETMNMYGIPKLMSMNYPASVDQPDLKARRIGESADWRTLSFAVRNMVGAGVIRPDDELEKMIRDEMDLPPMDPTTTRITGNIQERVQVEAGLDAEGNPIPAPAPTTMPGTGPSQDTPITTLPNANSGQPAPKPTAVPKGGAPQARGPRQTKPSSTPPRRNGGTDRSGGK